MLAPTVSIARKTGQFEDWNFDPSMDYPCEGPRKTRLWDIFEDCSVGANRVSLFWKEARTLRSVEKRCGSALYAIGGFAPLVSNLKSEEKFAPIPMNERFSTLNVGGLGMINACIAGDQQRCQHRGRTRVALTGICLRTSGSCLRRGCRILSLTAQDEQEGCSDPQQKHELTSVSCSSDFFDGNKRRVPSMAARGAAVRRFFGGLSNCFVTCR